MSFIAALTAAAPVLIPAAIGAAGGAGLGALTSEDGFSDDGWWKGMLMGGIGGGAGGAAGLFSGNPLGGLLGGGGAAAAPATTAGGLGTFSAPGVFNPMAGSLGSQLAAPSTGALGLTGNASALSALTPSSLSGSAALQGLPGVTAPSAGLFGGLGDMMSMPSQDTLTKGLLASMVAKNLGVGDQKQQQQARSMPLSRQQTTGLPPMRQGLPWQPSRGYQRRSLRR